MAKQKFETGLAVHVVSLIGTLGLSILNVIALKNLDILGIPFVLAGDLFVQLILVIIFVYNLVGLLSTPARVAGSILVSAWDGVLKNRAVRTFRKDHAGTWNWLRDRLSPNVASGLFLTIGLIVAAYALWAFSALAQAVFTQSRLVAVDMRIINLMPTIRTPGQNTFFSFFTFAAGPIGVAIFFAAAGVWAFIMRQRWLPVVIGLGIGAELVTSTLLKIAYHRPRPDRALALVSEHTGSFPSGHTMVATLVYGLGAYALYRSMKSSIARLVVILGEIILVFFVASSRVYLGAHYPSDVLAGAAIGAFVLTLFTTALEINARFDVAPFFAVRSLSKGPVLFGGVTLIAASLVLSPSQIKLSTVTETQTLVRLPAIDSQTVTRLPEFSETFTGAKVEPISFIYVGSQSDIETAFSKAGWNRADPSTASNLVRAGLASLQSDQYLNAPVTPAYLDARPETLAYEQPTSANTLKMRHHTRIWKTRFTLPNQKNIWVATASFDKSVGLGSVSKLPTHHIDANVDAEREYIAHSLGVSSSNFIRIVNPESGKNGSGDPFYTDGQALVIQL